MKTIILVLVLICSLQGFGQNRSYLDLRKEYRDYCNEITIDTLTQNGVVNYEIGDGLKLIPKDTVWNSISCPEYKDDKYYFRIGYGGISLSNLFICDSIYTRNYISDYSEPSVQSFQTKISRSKYCKVKQEPETQEGFWDWVNKNYLDEK